MEKEAVDLVEESSRTSLAPQHLQAETKGQENTIPNPMREQHGVPLSTGGRGGDEDRQNLQVSHSILPIWN